MFEFEDLETIDPSPIVVNFCIEEEILPMRLPRSGATPHLASTLWENDWGVRYAGRIRFIAPPGSVSRYLNPRADALPSVPAVVRLEGPGSVLTALALALKRRSSESPVAEGPSPTDAGSSAPTGDTPVPKKAGLGPLHRAAFRRFQSGVQKRDAMFSPLSDCTDAERDELLRREHQEYLKAGELRRKEEDRWAQEEARWSGNREREAALQGDG
mmetsp:Transcript_35000/g.63062  ORF Transcript_35000/g.63062 Transcript_35000/m.63062 type:complete len:214 (-) Transcript_35000:68-709(-)